MWARIFASLYDRGVRKGEEAGMRERRAELLRSARGRVLEIGAGTGLNLPLYPPAVSELILLEPDAAMRAQTRRKRPDATVLDAPAERIPLDDRCVDTIVSTLVLCTVEDPQRVLDELARVLKPGGQLLLIEHVRDADHRAAHWQDRLERPWRLFARGCHPNRDTAALLAAAGFELQLRRERWERAPKLVAPLIVGSARPPRR